jgi:hypothetical protein
MGDKKILIVHPYDKTTLFLNSIKNSLEYSFNDDVYYFNIETNDSSHKKCLEIIDRHPTNGLIIFLGHGRSDALQGSKADEFSPSLDWEDIAQFPDLYYFNENFITKRNAHVFSGKKVFCLACNSNAKIAEYAIEKGATTFLGFGNIPSSIEEFMVDGNSNITNEIVIAMRTELNYIVSKSIEYSISKSYNFEQLLNVIHFLINQKITEFLITKKDFESRYIFVDYLYHIKKEIIVHGDKKRKLIE